MMTPLENKEVSRDMTGEADGKNPGVDSTDGVMHIKGAGSYLAGMAVAIPILNVDGRRHTNNFSKNI